MATITITEILGSDNIAGSRITINSNFSKLVNAINTIETYLDSSFVPGASLNVGSALIKRYTRPITDQIFTCEATGLFGGNLNVGQDSGVTRDSVVGRHETVHGNFTLDGTVGVASIFTSTIPHSHDGSIISPQLYASNASNSLAIDPQTLTTPTTTSTARNIPTTSPNPLTTSATTAFSSPLDFATAPKIRPTGPRIIGKNKKAMAPQIMPTVENELPGLVGLGGDKNGFAVC